MENPVQVVGGGLAGTLVAARLVAHNRSVVHYAQPLPGEASAVAAGLYNTYTGMELRRTWQADTLLQALEELLAESWMSGARRHVYRVPIFRPFPDASRVNAWTSASLGHPDVALLHQPLRPDILHNPWGGLLIKGLGWVDIPPFLEAITTHLLQTGRYDRRAQTYCYPDTETCTTVFCEGALVNSNPWRPFRALQPLKGEILQLQVPGLTLDRIVNSGVYVLPRPDGSFTVGATYEKEAPHPQPTIAGLQELLARFKHLFPGAAPEVVAHRAGVRATTPDRKPILGRHPERLNFWFLNGLGTKGLLYSPYASKVIVEAILHNSDATIPAPLQVERKALWVS